LTKKIILFIGKSRENSFDHRVIKLLKYDAMQTTVSIEFQFFRIKNVYLLKVLST